MDKRTSVEYTILPGFSTMPDKVCGPYNIQANDKTLFQCITCFEAKEALGILKRCPLDIEIGGLDVKLSIGNESVSLSDDELRELVSLLHACCQRTRKNG